MNRDYIFLGLLAAGATFLHFRNKRQQAAMMQPQIQQGVMPAAPQQPSNTAVQRDPSGSPVSGSTPMAGMAGPYIEDLPADLQGMGGSIEDVAESAPVYVQ